MNMDDLPWPNNPGYEPNEQVPLREFLNGVLADEYLQGLRIYPLSRGDGVVLMIKAGSDVCLSANLCGNTKELTTILLDGAIIGPPGQTIVKLNEEEEDDEEDDD
jgi:hypothetical protein